MPGRSSRLQVEDSDSDGPAQVMNPPPHGQSRTAGIRGGRRGRHHMPARDNQEEIDIAVSDRSVSMRQCD
jgi:hypothetical protein